ncbi:MAG: hypothetical protein C4345_05335, partial [Chloroflexota bacterium]
MLRRTSLGLIVSLGVIGLLAGGMVTAALAQEASPTPESTSTIAGPPGYQDFITDLAAQLGLPPEVDAAVKATLKARVDQRAERIKQQIDAGNFPGLFDGGPRLGRHHPHAGGRLPGFLRADGRDLIRDVADFLGMTPRDLLSEWRQGSSLAQIAEAHGKSRDDLRAF